MIKAETQLAARQRVKQAFESIYREHRQGLYTLALSIAGRPDRAEDAVHDAFTRLLGSGNRPGGDPVAYAFAAVRNAAIDQRRRAGSRPVLIGDAIYADRRHTPGLAGSVPAGDEPLVEAETHEAVRRAMSELPDEQAQVILLKIHAGLTFEQIAQTLGEPMGTVASRYRRGLERLKLKLEGIAAA